MRVATQARSRCGYCLTPEWITGMPMEIDHIIPRARGGRTIEDNLWLACGPCNEYKLDNMTAIDPVTVTVVLLFDPRHQVWHEHFTWDDGGVRIRGVTPTGRATVEGLRLNRSLLVGSRTVWVAAGWHPPRD